MNDGIHFARGGSSRRRGGGGQQAPLLAAEGGEGRRDGRGGGKPSSRDRGKRGKEAAWGGEGAGVEGQVDVVVSAGGVLNAQVGTLEEA